MTNQFMEYVESRLHEWAEWFCKGNWYGIGYPTRSTIEKLMREGFSGKAYGPRPLPTHESAEEIEKLIMIMAKQNFDMAYALRLQYLTRGSLRAKSNAFNVSHMTFKYYVGMGKQWLAGRLSI